MPKLLVRTSVRLNDHDHTVDQVSEPGNIIGCQQGTAVDNDEAELRSQRLDEILCEIRIFLPYSSTRSRCGDQRCHLPEAFNWILRPSRLRSSQIVRRKVPEFGRGDH